MEEPKVKTADNEMRVTMKGSMRSWVSYAQKILEKPEHKELTIKALGNASNNAVILVEILKRKIGGLH